MSRQREWEQERSGWEGERDVLRCYTPVTGYRVEVWESDVGPCVLVLPLYFLCVAQRLQTASFSVERNQLKPTKCMVNKMQWGSLHNGRGKTIFIFTPYITNTKQLSCLPLILFWYLIVFKDCFESVGFSLEHYSNVTHFLTWLDGSYILLFQ